MKIQNVNHNEQVIKVSKQIIEQVLKQDFWRAIKIGRRYYMRTFQNEVVYF